ncbi:TonB-dependent receptor plug domain-containing protein [Flavivirga abyssicola]|uniref:TonB-dependent receptor plug domain-containing protein n=1 Tax=Flavivirga abyssicola TaxID=3063533 RepID=UPI0026E07D98|nr:TonB-dependent receptor plug domain-containing protein [Flavivirga sp. MEBiC07777]WVK13806.1 TonB-dependent receptor plug domain-containing protein [Flavivirga sp. MEBiC07777]
MKSRTQHIQYILLLVFSTFLLFQCNTSKEITTKKNTGNANTSASVDVKPNSLESDTQNIVDMLSKVSGVLIEGSGADASIIIRGVNTVNTGSSQPLFLVNGTVMGYGIRSVFYNIIPNQIQSIRVLKGSQASFYGSRGGAGVIEIILKE